MDKLGDATAMKRYASLGQAAENHNGSGAKVLLLVDAQFVNFGTIKESRNQGVHGPGSNVIILLGSRGERAQTKQPQEDTAQGDAQADQDAQFKEG